MKPQPVTVTWEPTGLLAAEVHAFTAMERDQSGLCCLDCGCVVRDKPQRVVIEPCGAVVDTWHRVRAASGRLFNNPDLALQAAQDHDWILKHIREVWAWTKKREAARLKRAAAARSGSSRPAQP